MRNDRPQTLALIGVAGYIAPRHLAAIKDTGNMLVAACDPNDSVGILDRYFRDVHFFTEFERFDRHLEKLRRQQSGVDYVSICSPNYLHDAHIRLALRIGSHAICEKPLVINPWNLEALAELELEFGRQIYTVLQLRLHPDIKALRQEILASDRKHRHQITLTYITSRGRWYGASWKGDKSRSGGVVTNIGIHFLDMLIWVFGTPKDCRVHCYEPSKASGFLELEQADVRWFLSLDEADLPAECQSSGQTTFRSIQIDGREIEFSGGFTDLHTETYRGIMAGDGFGIEEARPSIELVHRIRTETVKSADDFAHPLVR